jgi:hypothetical protein
VKSQRDAPFKRCFGWGFTPHEIASLRLPAAVVPERLEWGIASYQTFMLGLVLVLLAIVIVWTARVKRPIDYLMGLSGLAWLVLGWVLGAEGFAPIGAVPSDAAQAFLFAGSIWLLIVAWRRKESVQAAPAYAIHRQTRQRAWCRCPVSTCRFV